MIKKFQTKQEEFWAGEFGNNYIDRNKDIHLISANIALFSKILSHTKDVSSVLELGANLGLNLHAIKALHPYACFSAVEINNKAILKLKELSWVESHHASLLDFNPESLYDFVLVKGVLIHINPEYLPKIYSLLYKASRKYICIVEYYNPTPVEMTYRGHDGKLFKRDFAGEMLDKFNNLKLLDYGFSYHRDCNFPQDDMTWFLLEK